MATNDSRRGAWLATRAAAFGHRLWPRRLGSQLKLLVSLALWATIVLFGAHTIREQSQMALAGINQQAVALSRDLALLSENLILTDKLDVIEDLLRNSMEFAQVIEIQVVDAKGAPISRVLREPGGKPRALFDAPGAHVPVPTNVAAQVAVDAGGERVVAWHPIVAGSLLGWVRVDHGTAALRAIRERIWVSTAVACLLAGLVSAGLITLLLRKPLRAIDAARDFAVDLQRSDGQQLERIEGPQETVDLAQALNQASTRLHDQHRTIEASIAQLRRHEAALADSNEHLRTIFALSPDALVSFDAQGVVRFANAAFFRMTGLAANDIIDQHESVLDALLHWRCVDAAAYGGLASFFPDIGAGPAPAPLRRQLTLARPRHAVLELVGLLSHTQAARRLLYVRDITRESEIDRMKSEFLSTAAHELRTPMTGIHACVELMMAREFEPERRKHLLGIAHRQSQAMMSIVNELLDLARIEARRGEDFEYQIADLGSLVADAVGDFVPPPERGAIEYAPGAAALPVRVDPGKTAQVLRNLLSNAYKYSTDGAVQVRVLAPRPGPGGDRAGFEVEDHGIGMTPEQLARVCERFWRADASGHVLGTGLGMSIVKEIVGLMGGALEMASTPGRGTTVRVWLPLVDASCGVDPVPAGMPPEVEADVDKEAVT